MQRNTYEKLFSIDLKIDDSNIVLDPTPKFLGVSFDPKLAFTIEVENISAKMNQRIKMLKTLKCKLWSSPSHFLKHFYKSYICPLYEYSNFPLLTSSEANLNKIQVIQNKALRICINKTRYDHISTDTLYTETNTKYVKERITDLSNNYVQKTFTTQHNEQVLELFQEENIINSQPYSLKRKKRHSFL